jgi:phosphatidylinositol alpha-1,6-mannosyltransferase
MPPPHEMSQGLGGVSGLRRGLSRHGLRRANGKNESRLQNGSAARRVTGLASGSEETRVSADTGQSDKLNCSVNKGLVVLMLLSDGFGGRGGIAKFNRDFLGALDASPLVERVYALPCVMAEPVEQVIPESVIYDRNSARGRVSFVRRLVFHLWRVKRVDVVVCGHLHLLPLAWPLALFRGARLALIIHGIEAWAPPKKILAKWLSRRVNSVIAVSRFSTKRFTSWSKVPAERFFILPNCVDLEAFRPQPRDPALLERYGIGPNDKVLLTVGRMATQERYKGFDQMIELMPRLLRQFPNVKYLIVGDGDDRKRLEEKVMTYRVADHVIFTGHIPETEKVAHYNLADGFVMPSTGEGFGIVFIEAAACGVPVIGSLADGSREALLDGAIGQLVDPANPEDLMEKVGAVLQSPSERYRDTAIETFSLANFRGRVTKWCDIQVAANFAH